MNNWLERLQAENARQEHILNRVKDDLTQLDRKELETVLAHARTLLDEIDEPTQMMELEL